MKRLISLIVALLFLTTSVVGYGVLVALVDGAVERIRAALASAEFLTQKDSFLQSAQTLLHNVESVRPPIDEAVIASADVVEVIEILERVADEENVDLSIGNVVTRNVEGWTYHEFVTVTLSVEGSYVAVAGFFHTLEHLPVMTRLEQATLEKSGSRTWFGSSAVSFVKEKL